MTGSDYASLSEIGPLRARLLDGYTQTRMAALFEPSDAQRDAARLGVMAQARLLEPDERLLRGRAFQIAADGVRSDFARDEGELRRKAAALSLTGPSSLQPEDVGRPPVLGGLNTLLRALDTPRRLSFENVVLPLARRIGIDISENAPPEGRELVLAALGGDAAQTWLRSHLAGMGVPEDWARRGATLAFGAAGLAADVLFDPLTYLTLGTGPALLRGGGRALSQVGQRVYAQSVLTGVPAATLGAARAQGLASAARDASRELFAASRATVDQMARTKIALDVQDLRAIRRSALGAGAALTEPQADRMFSLLRSVSGGDEFFQPGGVWYRLPLNAAALHLPMLNREEQIGLFLGGREVTPGVLRVYDSVRRSAMENGEAALAYVPVNLRRAAGAVAGGTAGALLGLPPGFSELATGMGALAGALPDKLRNTVRGIFVNYAYLQGFGREAFGQMARAIQKTPRVEQEYTSKEIKLLLQKHGPLSQRDLDGVGYMFDIGVPQVQRDAAGNVLLDAAGQPQVVYETLADYATRLTDVSLERWRARNVFVQAGVLPRLSSAAPRQMTEEDLVTRLESQLVRLTESKRLLEKFPARPGVRPAELSSQLRPGALDPMRGGAVTRDTEVIQWQIEQVVDALAQKRVPYRLSPSQLLAPNNRVLFEQLVPEQRLRDLTADLLAGEREFLAGVSNDPFITQAGPIHAAMRMAQELGQESMLLTHLRHMYLPRAPGAASRVRGTPPQLGTRVPGNIGQQRVETFGVEPETLRAVGVVTEPDVMIGTTLAQYRTMAAEARFVEWALTNYGRLRRPADIIPEGYVEVRPREWFTQGMADPEALNRRLQFFRESGELSPEEIQPLMHLVEMRASQKAAGRRAGTEWVIPRDIDQALKENRRIVRHGAGIFAQLDALLSIQRMLVTTIWPAYHVRNFFGNAINSALGGVHFEDRTSMIWAVQALRAEPNDMLPAELSALLLRELPGLRRTSEFDAALTQGQTDLKAGWLRRLLETRGLLKTGQAAVDLSVDVSGGGGLVRAAEKFNQFWPFRVGRTASDAVDNTMKVRHFISRLRQGDSMEQAILSTKAFLFDFSDLSPAEQTVLRPAAYFYTWCLRESALALTEDGWRSVDALKPGDVILTYNQVSGLTEWQPICELGVFDYDGELLRHSGKSLDIVATPSHRHVVVDDRGCVAAQAGYRLRSNDRFILSAPAVERPDYLIDDVTLALVGWLVTDGCIRNGHYHIYQSPKKHADAIRALCGADVKEYVHPQTGVIQFVLRKGLRAQMKQHLLRREDLIRLVTRLSARQRAILREVMLDAEGHRHAGWTHFAQEDAVVLEAFQTLCALDGIAAKAGSRGCYVRTHRGPVKYVHPETVWYTGRVWCPVTKNGTWVAKDNGHIFITGNTRRNLPLQLEMLLNAPRSAQVWNLATRAVSDREAQRNADAALLPAWLREQLGLVFYSEQAQGRIQVMTGLGVPLEDLNLFNATAPEGLIRRIIGQGNPLVQYLANAGGMPTAFTHRTVDDDVLQNYYRQVAPALGDAIKLVPGLQDFLALKSRTVLDEQGRERTLYSADPWRLYFFYNVLAMGRVLRTVSEASRVFSEPEPAEKARAARRFGIRFGTGVRTTAVDVARPLEALETSAQTQQVDQESRTRLERSAQLLRGGQIEPAEWRRQRSDALAGRQAQRRQLLTEQLAQEGRETGVTLTAEERERRQQFRRKFAPEGQLLLDRIISLSPDGPNPLSEPAEQPFTSTRQFAEVREALLGRLRDDFPALASRYDAIRARWVASLPPAAQEVEREYQRAVALLAEYEQVPKYRNVSGDDARLVDELMAKQRALSSEFGPGRARRMLRESDSDGYRLLQRAVPNRAARRAAWRRLNAESGHLLTKYFRNVNLEEFSLA